MRTAVITILIALIVLFSAAKFAGSLPPPLDPDEQEVAGFRLKLQPPEGYCALEAGQTEDAQAIASLQHRLPLSDQVIFSYGDCGERARLRQGERTALITFGSIVIRQDNGKPRVTPTISRQDYLASFARLDGTAAVDGSHTKMLTDRNLAPSDRNARYIGGEYAIGGRQLAYVNAFTEIDSVPLVIGFSHIVDQRYGLDDLYRLQSGYVSKLISINEANEDRHLTNVNGVLTYKAPLTLADVVLPLSVAGLAAVFIWWRPTRKTPATASDVGAP